MAELIVVQGSFVVFLILSSVAVCVFCSRLAWDAEEKYEQNLPLANNPTISPPPLVKFDGSAVPEQQIASTIGGTSKENKKRIRLPVIYAPNQNLAAYGTIVPQRTFGGSPSSDHGAALS